MGNLDQQLKDAKAAPSHKNYSERKRGAMLKLHKQPLCPRLARLLFVCLLVLTCFLTIAEFFHSRGLSEPGVLLRNLSTTGLGIWCLYAVPLLLTSVIGMYANRKRFYQMQADSGVVSETEADFQRDHRAIRRLNHDFIIYVIVAATGILFWSLLFLFVH